MSSRRSSEPSVTSYPSNHLNPTTPTTPATPHPEMEHIASFIGRYGPDPDATVIPVMVEDVEVVSMIDDGATISVISTRFADLLEAMG